MVEMADDCHWDDFPAGCNLAGYPVCKADDCSQDGYTEDEAGDNFADVWPVAAIARSLGPHNRPRTMPWARRPIRIMPSTPNDRVVEDTPRSPIPSPSAPSPGPVVHQQRPDSDPHAEADERRHDDRVCTRPDVNHRGIILRHINHLRTGAVTYIKPLGHVVGHP